MITLSISIKDLERIIEWGNTFPHVSGDEHGKLLAMLKEIKGN